MFNLRLCNEATIRYSLLKFGYMHLCGKGYKYFSPHCCKCNSFGCIAAIRCGNACHGPHSDSVYSGSEHRQFNSPRLVKREAGFPWPRRALIGSNQVWRVNDSPYYRELQTIISYMLSREYRVARYRYSRLLFTSEDRLCAKLRVQWQDKYDVTIPVFRVRMTSQINCGDVTMLGQKRPPLATMAKWALGDSS